MKTIAKRTARTSGVTGRIVDPDGARLPGVTVTIVSDKTQTLRTTITNEKGEYKVSGLDPADNYVVTATLEGFNGSRRENVKVQSGKTTTLKDTKLSLASMEEDIVVSGKAPKIDPANRSKSGDYTLKLTESLPTSRTYQDYLQLVPGVQAALGSTDKPSNEVRRLSGRLQYRLPGGLGSFVPENMRRIELR